MFRKEEQAYLRGHFKDMQDFGLMKDYGPLVSQKKIPYNFCGIIIGEIVNIYEEIVENFEKILEEFIKIFKMWKTYTKKF